MKQSLFNPIFKTFIIYTLTRIIKDDDQTTKLTLILDIIKLKAQSGYYLEQVMIKIRKETILFYIKDIIQNQKIEDILIA